MSEWKDFKPVYKSGMFLRVSNGFLYTFKLLSMKLPKRETKKYKHKKSVVYNLPIFLKQLIVSDKEVAEKLKTDNLVKFNSVVTQSCGTNQVYNLQLSESAYNQLGLFISAKSVNIDDKITYERFGSGFGTFYG
ncbi:unnamed protein product, partial [marine sediment metagenome]